jgi:probable rRNA maturation factor
MIQHFDPSTLSRIAEALGGECTDQGQGAWRLVLSSEAQGRTIVVDIQFEVASEEVFGALVTIFAPGVVIQSHRCSQVVISDALQQVVLFDRADHVLTATILEQPAGVTHYAGVSASLLRADFTSLPEELMMSSLALSILDDEDSDETMAPEVTAEGYTSSIQLIRDSGPDAPLSLEQIQHVCKEVALAESKELGDIEVMLVDEARCMSLHLEHFQDGSITDTMTFPLHEHADEPIEGSLVLCTPRIVEQAAEHNVNVDHECTRVLIHSMLHLCGWSDDKEATDPDSTPIRVRENELLAQLYPLEAR